MQEVSHGKAPQMLHAKLLTVFVAVGNRKKTF
jgi:hypothetical protein